LDSQITKEVFSTSHPCSLILPIEPWTKFSVYWCFANGTIGLAEFICFLVDVKKLKK
jgi:hypothetical protein